MAWSSDEIDKLKRMHAKGQTYATIARAVGRTRNACIGKALRLGLTGDGPNSKGGRPRKDPSISPQRGSDKAAREPIPRAAQTAEQRMERRKGRKRPDVAPVSVPIVPKDAVIVETEPLRYGLPGEHVVTKFQTAGPLKPPPHVEPPIPEPVPQGGVLLMDLQAHHCRWPINDGRPFRFCGERQEPGPLSYCAHHLKMHYRHPNAAEVRKPYVKPKVSAFKYRAGSGGVR